MNIRIRLRKLFTPMHIHHPDGSETAASYIAPNWLLILPARQPADARNLLMQRQLTHRCKPLADRPFRAVGWVIRIRGHGSGGRAGSHSHPPLTMAERPFTPPIGSMRTCRLPRGRGCCSRASG
jgi:hypothetical protein